MCNYGLPNYIILYTLVYENCIEYWCHINYYHPQHTSLFIFLRSKLHLIQEDDDALLVVDEEEDDPVNVAVDADDL